MVHEGEVVQPKRFLQPCLLLLVAESPAHGYDLLERLTDFGFERDPGGLYRALRAMEREGLLHSAWDFSAAGPGRRCYRLTVHGHQRLHAWAASLKETRRIVQFYLDRYWMLVQHPSALHGPIGESRATPTIPAPWQ